MYLSLSNGSVPAPAIAKVSTGFKGANVIHKRRRCTTTAVVPGPLYYLIQQKLIPLNSVQEIPARYGGKQCAEGLVF